MRALTLLLLAGCSTDAVRSGDTAFDGVGGACAYPEGAVEPMAVGEVITPYRWARAADRATGAEVVLDLAEVPCLDDVGVVGSALDLLLFVSLPAW